MQELQFPIGEFVLPETVTATDISNMAETITRFPKEISELTSRLDDKALKKIYRPDGWNIRQLVHHCADSHMNALIRFKLTLTEDRPTIKPYEEAKWALLDDTLKMPIQVSLDIIKAIHSRWTVVLKGMDSSAYERIYIHPEHGLEFRLDQALANYDWHCRHHKAHIRLALNN